MVKEPSSDNEESDSQSMPENTLVLSLISQNEAKLQIPKRIEVSKNGLEFKRFNQDQNPAVCVINSTQISERHCEILFLGKSFFLGDKNSTNGTFILILPERKLNLEVGMHLELGNTDFVVKELKENEITLEFKTEENKKSGVYNYSFESVKETFTIGKDKNQRANTFYIYVNDDYMETTHARIKFDGEKIYLMPCNNKYGVWLNLKSENEAQRKLVLLNKNSIFRVSGDFHFKVTERSAGEKIGDCVECEAKKAEVILKDCKHISLCLECLAKLKRCPVPKCKGKTVNFYQILSS